MLIRPYHSNIKFQNFPNLDEDLAKHYDRIFDTAVDFHISPRYQLELGLKIGFRDIFYYIDTLYDNGPTSVVDVGCAECIWKRWFPNITGFDPNHNEFSQQDFVDFFDADFSAGHHEAWQNGMALNSVHFINWSMVNDQIDLAMHIVKERFLFTFNFNAMAGVPNIPPQDLVAQFRGKLDRSKYEIVLFDAPCLRGIGEKEATAWAYINGTVRFIISK